VSRTFLKFTAFMVVCAGFTVYLAFTIGNIHLFQKSYKLAASFDDVTGLLPNDNVKVAGVPVGKVTGISIVDGRAKVTMSIRKEVKVPTDSKAAVRWRNLLGQRYVYLYPGTASTSLRGGDTVAKTVSVVDLGELFNRLGPIVKAIDPAKVNEFLDAIVGALDGNQAKVQQSIHDLATLTTALGERDDAISRLVANTDTVAATLTSRDQQIRTVLDNLLAVARTFNENTDVLDTAVTELGDFSTNFGQLLSNNRGQIDRTVDNLTAIIRVVQEKLPVLDHAVAGLDEGAKRLFNSSRYGEWLNQVIPCGRIGYNTRLDVNNCVLGDGGGSINPNGQGPIGAVPAPKVPASTTEEKGAPAATSGADAVDQLLGGLLR
jgi:phospholipid/cholesterol/gamma-HCH transport system substrate-binding protein